MIQCPISYWREKNPSQPAFLSKEISLSYEELDTLVDSLTPALESLPQDIVAYIPKQVATVLDVAILWGAWRAGKAVYPLSFRLPKNEIEKRLAFVSTTLVDPTKLSLHKRRGSSLLDETVLATCIETSGTSGKSSLVCHHLTSHLASTSSAIQALQLTQESSYCLNLPLFHISGIATCLRTFFAGATLLLPDQWELSTHLSMVPTQVFRFLENNLSLPHLQYLLVGGAPLSPLLEQKALEHSLPLYTSYGMTETASLAILKKPLAHIEAKLQPDKELCLRGVSLFQYYWGQEKRDPKEWFATKDLACCNAQGEYQIIGRKDRQFICGGENIQPEEIERAFLQIPQVIEAHVYPMEDKEFGMQPAALLFSPIPLSIEWITRQLENHLPRFKIPKFIQVKNSSLKSSKLS